MLGRDQRFHSDDLETILDALALLFPNRTRDSWEVTSPVKKYENMVLAIKGVKETINSVDPALFQEPLEKELFSLLSKKGPELRAFLEKRDYPSVTRLYGETFFDPLHHFFDRVMVNVEDETLRRNRQALMKEINCLYTEEVADLSLLSQVKE
jgi:glycyl-tRNA synthetase beta chain